MITLPSLIVCCSSAGLQISRGMVERPRGDDIPSIQPVLRFSGRQYANKIFGMIKALLCLQTKLFELFSNSEDINGLLPELPGVCVVVLP